MEWIKSRSHISWAIQRLEKCQKYAGSYIRNMKIKNHPCSKVAYPRWRRISLVNKKYKQAGSMQHHTSCEKPRKRGSHRKHAGKQMSQFVLFDQLCVVLTLFWTLFQYRINIYTVENFQKYQFNTGVTWRLSLRIWLFLLKLSSYTQTCRKLEGENNKQERKVHFSDVSNLLYWIIWYFTFSKATA